MADTELVDAPWTRAAQKRVNGAVLVKTTDSMLPVIDFADIKARLDIRALIKGVLGDGTMSVFYGESGCTKTFLGCDLGMHVAAGLEWFGHRVNQGGVLYIAAEGSTLVQNRIAAFKKHHGIAEPIPFGLIPITVDLRSENADTDRLIATARATMERWGCPVRLVVVDTLSRAMAGGNENSPDDMGAYVMNIDKVRQAIGAHLLSIHHLGKDAAKGARGHSLLRAAADTEIEVVRDERSRVVTATAKKQRDMAEGSAVTYRLQPVDLGIDQDGDPVSSCVVMPIEGAAKPKSKSKPPSPNALLFHKALVDALVAFGKSHGTSNRKTVSKAEWRSECLRLGLIDADEGDKEIRKRGDAMANKYRVELISVGWIAVDGDRISSLHS